MSWREALKRPEPKPVALKPKFDAHDDDWETDITYQNQTTEKAQRYGSSAIAGSGRIDHVDFQSIQQKVKTADNTVKESYLGKNPNRGYGGKYGTENVMDKAAADYTYVANVPKHASQTDFKKGFGGQYGIDERAKDASAVGFDYVANVDKHPSQTDFSKGFGGKYGTDSNAQDKSAVGFSHRENVPKHSSQTDYNVGFGGKYGVQKEEPSRLKAETKPSEERKIVEQSPPPIGSSIGVGNIRARFENMKKVQEEEAAKRVAEERNKRAVNDQQSRIGQPDVSNGHDKAKQPATYEPPPPSVPRAVTPPTQQMNSTIYQNVESQRQESLESPQHYVGTVNVSSLLKQRKSSSSSSQQENNDDEWGIDYSAHNQQQFERREPSPTPETQTSNKNEGIRCIARYSYQKVEDDELGFEENEIITNVEKLHDEWWFGKIGQRSGIFPGSYVEEL